MCRLICQSHSAHLVVTGFFKGSRRFGCMEPLRFIYIPRFLKVNHPKTRPFSIQNKVNRFVSNKTTILIHKWRQPTYFHAFHVCFVLKQPPQKKTMKRRRNGVSSVFSTRGPFAKTSFFQRRLGKTAELFRPLRRCRKVGGDLGKTNCWYEQWKRAPGCLGYIGGYTTQLYRDYNKPI